MDFFPYLEIKSLRLDFYPKNNNYKHSYSKDPKCRHSKNTERKEKIKRERERESVKEEEEEEEMEMQAQANLGCAKPRSQRDPGRKPGSSATTRDPSLSHCNPRFCF